MAAVDVCGYLLVVHKSGAKVRKKVKLDGVTRNNIKLYLRCDNKYARIVYEPFVVISGY